MFRRIYLDHAATTPLDPDVLEAMMPYLTGKFGNASSIHSYGQEARAAVDKARHQAAELIGARESEIVFTSGGTEANNLAIRGILESNNKYGKKVIISAIEHPSVMGLCDDLAKSGYQIIHLPVYEDGIVRVEDIKDAIDNDTLLISVMTANNEIGTMQPVDEIGELVEEIRSSGRKIWFHTDAVQAIGKIEVNVDSIGCDLLTFSGHKLYGPKGVGGLYVRRGVRLHPQNIGGHQERERRGGTEAVANIVGFGAACKKNMDTLCKQSIHLERLREHLEQGARAKIPEICINGHPKKRLPNISNISFRGIEGEALLINLDLQGVAVSTGSACSSGSIEPSPIILALGHENDLARGAVRFSFGKDNTEADVNYLLETLPKTVEDLRVMMPGL